MSLYISIYWSFSKEFLWLHSIIIINLANCLLLTIRFSIKIISDQFSQKILLEENLFCIFILNCKYYICGDHMILACLLENFLCAMYLKLRKILPICFPSRGVWECQASSSLNIMLLVKKKSHTHENISFWRQ